MDKPPVVLCPYDAELYGHWWYEGPYWLYILFKKIYYDQDKFDLITPSEYIDKYPEIQVCSPCRSSWGANGYSEVWLNETNDYAHKHLHKIGDNMTKLAYDYSSFADSLDAEFETWKGNSNLYDYIHINTTSMGKLQNTKLSILSKEQKEKIIKFRAINQCARELLLLQSSDWLFIITNGTMVDYAKKRIKDHTGRFQKLYEQITQDNIDKKFLQSLEEKDCIFPEIDFRMYR